MEPEKPLKFEIITMFMMIGVRYWDSCEHFTPLAKTLNLPIFIALQC